MGKFFKISQVDDPGNKPYAPAEVPLPASADIPKIRPNPIKNSKPLTTKSDSSLDFKPKAIKLAKRDLYQYYKDKNWNPTKEPWWDAEKGLTYGWSDGKWGDPITPDPQPDPEPDPQPQTNKKKDWSEKLDEAKSDPKKLEALKNRVFSEDFTKNTTDSIRVHFGKEPMKWPKNSDTSPSIQDTLGTAAKNKIFKETLDKINENK